MDRGSCAQGNGLQLYLNERLEEEKKNASEMPLKKIFVVDIQLQNDLINVGVREILSRHTKQGQ